MGLGLSFAAALRAIGGDLDSLFIQSLEISLADGVYTVRGVQRAASHHNGGAADGPPKKNGKFERSYFAEDIARLDRLGRKRQTDADGTPDPGSLHEALRLVGGIVDARGGRFLKLVKHGRKIAFEYLDASGTRRDEERYGLGLYKKQLEVLSARGQGNLFDVHILT
ncbi:MAG TPA: hypothetical protein VKH64_00540 [Candidatus Binatia bacterium]|nr:hypothetical protein [Candidatus Binatia bacterium]